MNDKKTLKNLQWEAWPREKAIDGIMRQWRTNAGGCEALQLDSGVIYDVPCGDTIYYPGAVIEEPIGREHYTFLERSAAELDFGIIYPTVQQSKNAGRVGIWVPKGCQPILCSEECEPIGL